MLLKLLSFRLESVDYLAILLNKTIINVGWPAVTDGLDLVRVYLFLLHFY